MASEITDSQHTRHLQRTIALAVRGKGQVSPNPMVGCVIVHGNDVVAEGWHAEYGGIHAEVMALRALPPDIPGDELTLYVSLEPCNHHGKQPPCTHAIVLRGIGAVVIGLSDPNPGVQGNGSTYLSSHGIQVIYATQQQAEACAWINRCWLTAVTQHRPYVIAKVAQSADGFMAPLNKERLQLTGIETQHIVHAVRAEVDAVLVGMGTVRSDNPRLTVRDVGGRNPKRIVVGNRSDLPPSSYIATTLNITPTYFIEHGTNLSVALRELYSTHTIQSILCEAGPTVTNTLLSDNLVDELRVHTSPVLLGTGQPWCGVPSGWHQVSTELSGLDTLTTFVRNRP